jgi:hypothetical protein
MKNEPNPSLAHLVVTIQRRDDGSILTDHRPMSDEDMTTLMGWPTNGQVHVAQALLTEAIRREARVMVLTELSKGRQRKDLDPDEIDGAVRAHFLEFLGRFSRQLSEAVLNDLRQEGAV